MSTINAQLLANLKALQLQEKPLHNQKGALAALLAKEALAGFRPLVNTNRDIVLTEDAAAVDAEQRSAARSENYADTDDWLNDESFEDLKKEVVKQYLLTVLSEDTHKNLITEVLGFKVDPAAAAAAAAPPHIFADDNGKYAAVREKLKTLATPPLGDEQLSNDLIIEILTEISKRDTKKIAEEITTQVSALDAANTALAAQGVIIAETGTTAPDRLAAIETAKTKLAEMEKAFAAINKQLPTPITGKLALPGNSAEKDRLEEIKAEQVALLNAAKQRIAAQVGFLNASEADSKSVVEDLYNARLTKATDEADLAAAKAALKGIESARALAKAAGVVVLDITPLLDNKKMAEEFIKGLEIEITATRIERNKNQIGQLGNAIESSLETTKGTWWGRSAKFTRPPGSLDPLALTENQRNAKFVEARDLVQGLEAKLAEAQEAKDALMAGSAVKVAAEARCVAAAQALTDAQKLMSNLEKDIRANVFMLDTTDDQYFTDEIVKKGSALPTQAKAAKPAPGLTASITAPTAKFKKTIVTADEVIRTTAVFPGDPSSTTRVANTLGHGSLLQERPGVVKDTTPPEEHKKLSEREKQLMAMHLAKVLWSKRDPKAGTIFITGSRPQDTEQANRVYAALLLLKGSEVVKIKSYVSDKKPIKTLIPRSDGESDFIKHYLNEITDDERNDEKEKFRKFLAFTKDSRHEMAEIRANATSKQPSEPTVSQQAKAGKAGESVVVVESEDKAKKGP